LSSYEYSESHDKVDSISTPDRSEEQVDNHSEYSPSEEDDSLSHSETVNSGVLLVYPFELAKERAIEVSLNLTELGGNRLGFQFDNQIFDDRPIPNYGSSRTSTWEIKQPDFSRLRPGKWLNDSIMGFFLFGYLSILFIILNRLQTNR
jgi:Ulp1 family protease